MTGKSLPLQEPHDLVMANDLENGQAPSIAMV